MGVIVKQSIKGTLVSYAGAVLGYVNILLLFPLVFSTEQIGLYRVLIDAATFFVILSQLGILHVSVRYFSYFENTEKKHNGFMFNILLVPLFGFLLIAAVFIIFKTGILANYSEKSPLIVQYGMYVLPLTFFLLFSGILAQYCTSLLKIVVPKFIRETGIRLVITAGTALFFYKALNFNGFIVFVIAGYAFGLLSLIGYIKYLKQWFIKPDFRFLTPSLTKQMSLYGIIMFLGSGSEIIVAKIDTLMLGSLSGLENTGIYTIAFYIATILELPRRAMTEIATPVVASSFKKGNIEIIKDIYQKSSINLLIAGGLFFVGIWSNIDSIFQLIPNSETFIKGKYVVLFIGLAKLLDMSMGLNGEIIINSKYYKWNIFLMPFLAITAIITNYIFIPVYGITGAAIATLISIMLYNIIRFSLVLIKLKLQPFSLNTIKAITAIAVVYGVNLLIPGFENVILDVLLRSSIILFLFAVLILTLKPSENINEIFKTFLNRIK